MLAKTKTIGASIDLLNACYDWSEVDTKALPAALEADRALDASSITIAEWEQAWMRAGKKRKF